MKYNLFHNTRDPKSSARKAISIVHVLSQKAIDTALRLVIIIIVIIAIIVTYSLVELSRRNARAESFLKPIILHFTRYSELVQFASNSLLFRFAVILGAYFECTSRESMEKMVKEEEGTLRSFIIYESSHFFERDAPLLIYLTNANISRRTSRYYRPLSPLI